MVVLVDNKELENIKADLLSNHWTEEFQEGLEELDQGDAKKIVESMTEEEIDRKVNTRNYQEAYISDYLEYIWELSETSFWKQVEATFNEDKLLFSDNDFYLEKICREKIPESLMSVIIQYMAFCDEDDSTDLDLLSDMINSQIKNFNRLEEIKINISYLPEDKQDRALVRLDEMIKSTSFNLIDS